MPLIWKDDPAYPLNAAFMSRQLDVRPGLADRFLEVNAGGNGVVVKADTIIPLKSGSTWKTYIFTADTAVTTLDTGSLTLGTNYYVYLCDNNTDNGLLLLSANSTAPSGYTASNSRKIGGFHYGRRRNSMTVADVTSNVVVPNSVWDLCHRPRCSPEGMAYIGNGVWVDIYLVSVNAAITFSAGNGSPLTGGSGRSAYNAVPLTGTEGLNWYNFAELAQRSGKRLLTIDEWIQAAYGSPQGNDTNNVNAWSATSNTGRQNTGQVVNAISLLNIVDCAGNVFEWTDNNSDVGENFWITILGGSWNSGTGAHSRRFSEQTAATISTSIGARFACDSL